MRADPACAARAREAKPIPLDIRPSSVQVASHFTVLLKLYLLSLEHLKELL